MKLGLGFMGIRPQDFWNYSLREWQATVEGFIENKYGKPQRPMNKSRLQELMERYPDDRPST
jgi:Phage tail assembly chaperone protein, TAC